MEQQRAIGDTAPSCLQRWRSDPKGLSIAAVTVFYNPSIRFVDNIFGHLDRVDVLYAIDNSDRVRPEVVQRLRDIEKVRYISNGKNLGIARALNIAARKALEAGCDYLLTMDQDSHADRDMIPQMLNVLDFIDPSIVGIVSPYHLLPYKELPSKSMIFEEAEVVMTSGNLLNLAAYRTVGPFDENLFIDCVDHDYCLRLNLKGYKILIANRAILRHQLGRPIECRDLFWKKKIVKSYPPIRKYYRMRNRLYMMAKYENMFPDYHKASRQAIWQDLKYTIKFETKKIAHLRMIMRGFLDFKRTRWGKFQP